MHFHIRWAHNDELTYSRIYFLYGSLFDSFVRMTFLGARHRNRRIAQLSFTRPNLFHVQVMQTTSKVGIPEYPS